MVNPVVLLAVLLGAAAFLVIAEFATEATDIPVPAGAMRSMAAALGVEGMIAAAAMTTAVVLLSPIPVPLKFAAAIVIGGFGLWLATQVSL